MYALLCAVLSVPLHPFRGQRVLCRRERRRARPHTSPSHGPCPDHRVHTTKGPGTTHSDLNAFVEALLRGHVQRRVAGAVGDGGLCVRLNTETSAVQRPVSRRAHVSTHIRAAGSTVECCVDRAVSARRGRGTTLLNRRCRASAGTDPVCQSVPPSVRPSVYSGVMSPAKDMRPGVIFLGVMRLGLMGPVRDMSVRAFVVKRHIGRCGQAHQAARPAYRLGLTGPGVAERGEATNGCLPSPTQLLFPPQPQRGPTH